MASCTISRIQHSENMLSTSGKGMPIIRLTSHDKEARGPKVETHNPENKTQGVHAINEPGILHTFLRSS